MTTSGGGAPAAPQPLQHPAALALAGCLALAVAIGIGRFVYTPILPYMTTGLGLGKSEAGLIASANFLGYLLGALAAAWRPVPGDARLWLLGALVASAATTGAMGLTENLGAFLALRFANGALAALVMVLASSLTMDRLAAAGRAVWAAGIYAGVGVGIAASSVAVPLAALGDGDSQGPWLVCGALSLALAIPVLLLLPGRREPAPARKTAERRRERRGLRPVRARIRPVRLRLCHHRHLHFRHGARRPGPAAGGEHRLALRRAGGGAVGRVLGLGGAALEQ